MYCIPPILKEIAAKFSHVGKKVFLVGGAVRDMLRGIKAHDFDLATDALPEEVSSVFKRVFPTGITHGTVTVYFKGQQLEVTTFRTEIGYSDGRHPDMIHFTSSIEEDLSRRDFTMNAMALNILNGTLIDPFHGAADIQHNIIRCVGDPVERFNEDGLRPLRAVRFAAQLNFSIDSATLEAIPACIASVKKVSQERIRDEIDKIIDSQHPSTAFLLMEKTTLLALILPELAQCRGIEQKGFHRFDVLDHVLLACDYAAQHGYPHTVRLAALLHDSGKPLVREEQNGVWTFYNHEQKSAALAESLLNRLRYPHTVMHEVTHLIKNHMFHYEESWTDAAVRRFIIRVGVEHLTALYQLRFADAFATAKQHIPVDYLAPLTTHVEKILAESHCFSLKDLAINGNDLMQLGIEPGPNMGIILNELLETVISDPALNTFEQLKTIACRLKQRKFNAL
ncbi:MAG: HD domain-containing protein [Treponema sp.]|jgi:tRNA nucleotidyltransferase/poly(A) polymerase|nr:HD domain-containing protein [Treponema sp.]